MESKFYSLKRLIIILIMVHSSSSTFPSTILMAPLKPANCFIPDHCYEKCRYRVWAKPDYVFRTWAFEPFIKICIPYYSHPEDVNCCTGYTNLPQTRKECEDLCGEPCIITRKNYMTEPGICQYRCFDDGPSDIPDPCVTYNGVPGAGCCSRGYDLPTSLVKFPRYNVSQRTNVPTKTNKLIWFLGNKSMTTNITLEWIAP